MSNAMGEVVLVQGKTRARLVAQEAGIRRRRPFRHRMEQELGVVAEAAHFLVHLVGMPEFGGVVLITVWKRREFARRCTQ